MNTAVLYIVMICASLFMTMIPFGVFMGVGSLVGLPSSDIRMTLTYFVVLLTLAYAMSLLSFAMIQKSNCGEIKNFKQIALNSLVSVAFHVFLLLLIFTVPWFRNVVTNLFSPEIDQTLRDSIGYGYYSFWATMFGVALGGTLSASCAGELVTNVIKDIVSSDMENLPSMDIEEDLKMA